MPRKRSGPGRARQRAGADTQPYERFLIQECGLSRQCVESNLDLVEIAARAIYGAHRKSSAPRWEQASASVREWVRVQARAAIAALRAANGP